MNAALFSSKKMDYCTPQAFFDVLNSEFHFALDAPPPVRPLERDDTQGNLFET